VGLVQQQAQHQLGRLAGKLADEAIKVGATLMVWLKDKLTGAARVVLDELAREPEDQTNLDVLRLQLRKVLAEDEHLREELRAMLGAQTVTNIKQHSTVDGKNNIVVQAGRDARIDKR
jgi:hypothetical protein